jgi:hypothetical protein
MAKAPTKSPDAGGGSFGQVPQLNSGMLFSEVGSSGLRAFAGWVREEFLPELIGRQGARVYREMGDNSPIVGAVLFAVQGVLRKAEWRVEAANDTPEAQQMADFVEGLKDDMSAPWEDFVTETLSMLQYGYAPHEIVYKRRNGRKGFKSPTPSSRFDDGLIGWHKLPLRGQDTVLKWFFDANGKVLGLTQQPWIGPLLDVPMEKLLLFRPTLHKNNPEGRALDPETMIPTPDGWRKLDDLDEGDKVFDEAGRIRYVTARADWDDRPCYRVTFGDGTSIIADANHQWVTTTLSERSKRKAPQVRTTTEIASSVKTGMGSSNHGIAWASALDYPAQVLPLDPYVLGMWLGDGHSRTAAITCHADDLDETMGLIEAAGYPVESKTNGDTNGQGRLIRVYGGSKWASDGPSAALRVLVVMENKHIPAAYLRGSIEQRRALLAGLMDSDGYVDATGRCEFTNTNASLSFGVAELVRSLGIGAALTTKTNSHGNLCWLVKFTPKWAPFRLSRKIARCRTERQRTNHYIAAVDAVEPRRTVCIEVDSPSHLFLAGEAMVPTHNSILRNAYRPYFFIKRLEEQEAILFERMSGLPVMRVPNALLEAAASGDATANTALTAYKKLVANVRIDEQMGLLIPSDTYAGATGPSNVAMYEFKLETPQSGRANLDANTPIIRHKNDILTSILCDFIEMGHTSRGAQNLAETKVDLFMQASEGWLNSIAAVMNRHALPRLFALNGFDEDLMPEFVPDMAQRTDLDVLSNFILRMSQAGMPLFPDSDLEAYVRDAAGLPDAADDDGFDDDMREDAAPGATQEDPQRAKLRRVVGNSVLRAIAARKRGR